MGNYYKIIMLQAKRIFRICKYNRGSYEKR